MNIEENNAKLEHFSSLIAKHRSITKTKKLAIVVSNIIHALMLIPFVVNFYALTKFELFEAFGLVEFLKDIPAKTPLYASDFKHFAIYGAISLFVIPILAAVVIIIIGRFIPVKSLSVIEDADAENRFKIMTDRFTRQHFNFEPKLWVYDLIVSIVLGIIGCYPLYLEAKASENARVVELIFAYVFGFAAVGIVVFIAALILNVIFNLLQKPLYADSSSWWKNYRLAKEECKGIYKEIKSEREKAEKEEKERIEAEERRIAEEEKRIQEENRRIEEEKRRQEREMQAKKAEEEFAKIENPAECEEEVERLAEEGSPSACGYIGKKLYTDYVQNSYTKSEKSAMISKIKKYLKISGDAGNVESEFLSLSARAMSETYTLDGWKRLLTRARKIKQSGELSEDYSEAYDTLVNSVVEVIDQLEEEKSKPKPKPQPKEVTYTKKEPVLKRTYCKYCVGGVCQYYSSDYHRALCDYLHNPGQCAAALNKKALAFEFE